jgi:hypothetical protein
MKRVHLLIAVVLAALGGAAVLAVSAGGQAPPATPADFTVTTTQRERDTTYIDNPPRRRESAGDMFLGTGRITGAKTGTLEFACTVVSRRASVCQGAASFSDGEVHVSARVAGESRTLRIAIVGGTGAYNGARGTLTSTTTSSNRQREIMTDAYDFVD